MIADNLSAHKTKQVTEFLARHPTVHLHFTPTYASGLNQVELWFAKIERDVIARGVFTSVSDLRRKLMRYIRQYNKSPKNHEVALLRPDTSPHSQFSRYSPLVSAAYNRPIGRSSERAKVEWPALLRKLDRIDPSYRQ